MTVIKSGLRLRDRKSLSWAQTKSPEPDTSSTESFFDVLNRDQRTIFTINRSEERRNTGKKISGIAQSFSERHFFPKRLHSTRTHVDSFEISGSDSVIDRFVRKIKSRRWGSRRTFVGLITRLSEVFIVGVCLLTVVRVPTAMSAPSSRHGKTTEQIHPHRATHAHVPTERALSYLHPCGKNREEEMNNSYYQTASKESDLDILEHILIRTNNTLSYAESFKDRYVEKTFHLRFQQHHDHLANIKYDWLPNEGNGIPKRLGHAVDPLHLKNNTFDEFLIKIYKDLQIFAVGLEQIVIDQNKTHGEFRENFRMTEVHLITVLCEIREAMMERDVVPKNQVPRSIMKDEIRQLESSYRNLRDWLIYRDLMNCLEYVIQVFAFIKKNLSESSASSS